MSVALQPSPELLLAGVGLLALAGALTVRGRAAAWIRWIAILIGAQALWLSYLAQPNLGIDGGLSLTLAILPLAEMAAINAADVHPPAYYALLHFWSDWAGLSPFAARYLSVLAGLGAVAATGAAGVRLGGQRAGQFAALAVAVTPGVALLATTVRDFMPALALAALAVGLWLRQWCRPLPTRWREVVALGIVFGAGLWTSYLFAVVIGVLGVASAAGGRRLVRNWLVAALAGGVLWLPWLIYEIRYFVARFTAGQTARTAGVTPEGPDYFLREASRAFSGGLPGPWEVVGGVLALALFAWCLTVWVGTARAPGGDRRPLVLGALAGPLALLGCYLLMRTWANITAVERYVIFVLPFAAPALGYALACAPGRLRWPGVAAGAAAGVLALGGSLDLLATRYAPSDQWHPVALVETLDQIAGPDAAIVFVTLEHPSYYEALSRQALPWTIVPVLPEYVAGDVAATADRRLPPLLERAGGVWAVSYLHGLPGSEQVLDWLREHAYPAGEVKTPDSTLYGFVSPRPGGETHGPEAEFGGSLILDAATFPGQVAAGGGLPVDLRWRVDRPLAVDYTAFVHLVTPDQSRRVAGHDGLPFGGRGAASRWIAGDTYRDPHGLLVPPDTPPGEYLLVAGWYRDGQRLQLGDGGTQAVLGPVRVLPAGHQPSSASSG